MFNPDDRYQQRYSAAYDDALKTQAPDRVRARAAIEQAIAALRAFVPAITAAHKVLQDAAEHATAFEIIDTLATDVPGWLPDLVASLGKLDSDFDARAVAEADRATDDMAGSDYARDYAMGAL